MKNLRQAGFTLIELAVALTALSALAAIVVPAVK
ncbi:MAG TPA: prepilin-type N-terminal cleavage/methylation domain-containing protein [Pyrinomonadaceae bacterium]|jgi:prepilin-type N-terminal cleavage/methylation domain-containing protein